MEISTHAYGAMDYSNYTLLTSTRCAFIVSSNSNFIK